MIAPFSGGWVCGSIRYVCARANRDAPKTCSVRAGSGSLATRSFCSDCGTPLFTWGEAGPEFMSIRFPTPDSP